MRKEGRRCEGRDKKQTIYMESAEGQKDCGLLAKVRANTYQYMNASRSVNAKLPTLVMPRTSLRHVFDDLKTLSTFLRESCSFDIQLPYCPVGPICARVAPSKIPHFSCARYGCALK